MYKRSRLITKKNFTMGGMACFLKDSLTKDLPVITESLAFAEQFLHEALKEYEGNGIRYEPSDRQALIDLINEVDDLKKRLTSFMAGLAFMDHHPIDQTSQGHG